jgi:hypothetical protein
MIEALRTRGIRVVDKIIISHSDSDHLSGVLSILADKDIVVRELYLNADAEKQTKAWRRVIVAVRDARLRTPALRVRLGVTSDDSLGCGDLDLEVLAPTPMLAMGGPGSSDLDERRIRANTTSIVVRVKYGDIPLVLFCGDLDGIGLSHLLSEHPHLDAKVLVFPHHGGRPGGHVVLSAFSAYFVVKHWKDAEFDAATGVNHERTEIRNEAGEPVPADLWTGCYTPRELRLLCEIHDLRVDAVSSVEPGAYAIAPPTADSPEFLLLATRIH